MPRTKKPGPKPLAESKRRVLISARILPKTKAFLDSLEEPSLGRALDRLVVLASKSSLQRSKAVVI